MIRSDYCINSKWKYITLVILVVLGYKIYHLERQIRCIWGSFHVHVGNNSEAFIDEIVNVRKRLKQVTLKFEALKKKHSDLITHIRSSPRFLNDSNLLLRPFSPGPLLNDGNLIEEYEYLRRRIYFNTKELWYYINGKLSRGSFLNLKPEEKRAIIEEVTERKRLSLSDQEQLLTLDGYETWRRKEAASVSDLVQRRLSYLQNPTNCHRAKKLVCQHDDCGFGCQHHHLVYCLVIAYSTKRVLILTSYNWKYNGMKWTDIFYSLSENCSNVYRNPMVPLSAVRFNSKVVLLPYLRSLPYLGVPKFLPFYIPKDLAKRIIRFNGDPASWWIGQMIKYILRPRKHIQKIINHTIATIGFKWPVVGVHVRRTDKVGTEADFHDISEYMSHVDEYYTQLELTRAVDERRVYLATDDPRVLKEAPAKYPQYIIFSNISYARVLKEAITKYPQYTFYGNISTAQWANTSTRHTPASLTGLLLDLYLLSMCDYVVCTFTSNIGRMVYEMMQTNRVDASSSFHSLDHIYYFTRGDPNYRDAIFRNVGGLRTIKFDVGDRILIKTWNCTNKDDGTVLNTNVTGPFPWYKTVQHIMAFQYPEYLEVPIHKNTTQNFFLKEIYLRKPKINYTEMILTQRQV